MRKQLLLFALLLSIFFSACKTQCPPLTDSQKADIEKQIRELWDKLTIPILNADADGYAPFISSDEFIADYEGGTLALRSKTELIDTLRNWFSNRKSNEFQQKTVKITVLSDNLVAVDQLCILQINFKDDTRMRLNDAISFIFKKETSGWKIIHVHESWKLI